jgi:WD40 repeat protein
MNRHVQPQPPPLPLPAGRPSPSRSSSRAWVWLAVLLGLLLLGGIIALALSQGGPGETASTDPVATRPAGTNPVRLPACSDDGDPKTQEPLDFGSPIQVPLDRHALDALKDHPLPPVEIYPWQPERLVAILGEHRMRGTLFALSPDGKRIAVVMAGEAILRIGGVDTLHEKQVIACPAALTALAWSPDGNTIAAAGADAVVRLHDVRDPAKPIEPLPLEKSTAAVTSLSFSGDGKYLLGGEPTPKLSSAWLWEIATRKVVRQLKHTGPVLGVALSPVAGDYRALTAGGVEDGILHLWDAVTGMEQARVDFNPPKGVRAEVALGPVGFSTDGKRAFSCHPDGIVRLWDVGNLRLGAEVQAIKGHAGPPLAAFTTDGKFLATARWSDGGVWLWDAQQGKQVRRLALSGAVYALRFLPGGDRLVFAGSSGVDINLHIHEVETAKEVMPPAGHIAAATCVSLGPSGQVLASGGADRMLRLWDLRSVAQRHAIPAGGIVGVGHHPEGKMVFAWAADVAVLSLVDIETGQPKTPKYDQQHNGGILSAALTADGRYAVTGGYHDGTLRMWRLRDGKQVRYFDLGPSQGAPLVSIAPDMRRAIRIGGGKMHLLHLRCREIIREWPAVAWAPFLPDGRALFAGGPDTPTWQITANKVEAKEKLPLNLSGLVQGQLSADGRRVAAVIGPRVAAFDVKSGQQLWTWTPPPHFGGVRSTALSADGGHLMTANGDGTVYIVALP